MQCPLSHLLLLLRFSQRLSSQPPTSHPGRPASIGPHSLLLRRRHWSRTPRDLAAHPLTLLSQAHALRPYPPPARPSGPPDPLWRRSVGACRTVLKTTLLRSPSFLHLPPHAYRRPSLMQPSPAMTSRARTRRRPFPRPARALLAFPRRGTPGCLSRLMVHRASSLVRPLSMAPQRWMSKARCQWGHPLHMSSLRPARRMASCIRSHHPSRTRKCLTPPFSGKTWFLAQTRASLLVMVVRLARYGKPKRPGLQIEKPARTMFTCLQSGLPLAHNFTGCSGLGSSTC